MESDQLLGVDPVVDMVEDMEVAPLQDTEGALV